MAQATFQLSLAAMQMKSRSYCRQYNQSRFENMRINHQNTVFHKLWQIEFMIGPENFESPLNLIAHNRRK